MGLMVTMALVVLPAPVRGDEPGGCPADEANRRYWREVRSDPASAGDPNELAPRLLPCLGSADAELRDRFAFELLAYWLRQEQLTPATVDGLRRRLEPWLDKPGPEQAYARAFAALILSELVRFDSLSGHWDTAVVESLLADALAMMAAEDDFRGLTYDHGWIHTIAHGADLLWRLARHPQVTAGGLARILDGVADKAVPPGKHPYVFGEADRLARAALAVVERDLLPAPQVQAWLARFGEPRHLDGWPQAYQSPAGMAELHNTRGFLRALREALRTSGQSRFLQAVDTALAALP